MWKAKRLHIIVNRDCCDGYRLYIHVVNALPQSPSLSTNSLHDDATKSLQLPLHLGLSLTHTASDAVTDSREDNSRMLYLKDHTTPPYDIL